MLEICYLARGQQSYRVGQTRYELTGGDVFLTFPDEPHGTGTDPESKGTLYWCLLRLPEKNERFLSLSPGESRQLIARLLALPRHFRVGDAPATDLNRVFAVYRQTHLPLGTVELRNLLLRFLLSLVRACGQRELDVSPAIHKSLRFIDSHPMRMLPIRELARVCGLSESRFKERFRGEVGVPPAEYMARRKIDAAKSLLRSGGRTVTAIAMDLGFSSSQYFATAFKRYTGRTPGEYRRNGE
jgi:AraC-like DNA-binding protein